MFEFLQIIRLVIKELKIGNLTIPIPIIQGGMGVGISMSGLAVAVANQGGVGVISAAGLGLVHHSPAMNYLESNIEALKNEIRKAKEKTKGIIGVNIMVAMSNFEDIVKTAISEKVDIIFSGAGLPMDLPKFLTPDSNTNLVPIVSSARAAKLLCERWFSKHNYLPDAFVVEGPKAGGHLGFKNDQINDPDFSLENIVPQVVSQITLYEEKHQKDIPVIAAGGIYTGEDMFNIMQKGAKAVQLGTRFVTTVECDASAGFKQAYIDSKKEDVVIIESPVGLPGRAINNDFLESVRKGLKVPVNCPLHCVHTCLMEKSPYCIFKALYNAYYGNFKNGYAFAGSNAYRATKINTVKEVFDDLIQGYQQAYNKANLIE